MAFTQSQLDALETSIATGSLECRFDGKEVRYRSLDEMMRIRETIRAALGFSGSGKRFGLSAFTRDSSTPNTPNCFSTNNTE